MPTYTFRFPSSLPNLPVTVYPLVGGVRGTVAAATGTTGSDASFTASLAAGDYLAAVKYQGRETVATEGLASKRDADASVTVNDLLDSTSDANTALRAALVTPQALGRQTLWAARFFDTTKPIVYDHFDRADVTGSLGTASSGQAWSFLNSSTWSISSHRAVMTTAPNNGGTGLATVDAGQPVDFVQAEVQLAATHDFSLLLRCPDNNNHVFVQFTGTSVNIWKKIAGTFTQLAGQSGLSTATNGVGTLRGEYNRGTGKVTATWDYNGHPRGSVSAVLDSTARNALELDTHVGIRGFNDFVSASSTFLAGVKQS